MGLQSREPEERVDTSKDLRPEHGVASLDCGLFESIRCDIHWAGTGPVVSRNTIRKKMNFLWSENTNEKLGRFLRSRYDPSDPLKATS